MTNDEPLRDPWLIAVWPGMGTVALGAGGYLVNKLGARLVHELPARDFFDIQQIEINEGVARIGRLPRSMVFEYRHPGEGPDLLIFVGEAQPPNRGYSCCHTLLDYAVRRGVKRIVTFAAMATQLHPSNDPRVFGVATDKSQLPDLQQHGVEVLEEGQISGLNGVLLAAGMERNLPGVCLLGELPFFAVGVPNPKASQAVLEVFSKMAGVEIDFTEIAEQARTVEQGLLQLLEKMQDAAQQQAESEGEGFSVPEFTVDAESGEEGGDDTTANEPTLDYATRHRIESLFEEARQDRTRAFRLKQELDRLGVFEQYEDRFLDLFRKGE
jgi:proteasome assembly chaperone (PAC2) family protein